METSHLMLITPTLLNGWRWYMNARASEYDPELPDGIPSAEDMLNRKEFLDLLRRVRVQKVSEPIELGKALETDVQEYAEMGGYKGAPYHIKRMGEMCRGGVWQEPISMVFEDRFLLYGRIDHMLGDCIDDIKFVMEAGNYDVGKFLKSSQHPIYLEITQLPRFRYLVSDGFDYWVEEYRRQPDNSETVRSFVHEFERYLTGDDEARDLFTKHWKARV